MNNFEKLKQLDYGEFCSEIIDSGFYEMSLNEFIEWLRQEKNVRS